MQPQTVPAPAAVPAPEIDNRSAIDLFRRRAERTPSRTGLRYKEGGVWKPVTWGEWDTASREIAGGLRSLGIAERDRVCIIANTRVEWVFSDVGIVYAGAVTVPIYQSNLAEQCEYIISDSGARLVIAEDPHQLEKLLEVKDRLGKVIHVVLMSDVAHLEKPDDKGRSTVRLEDVLPAGHPDAGWVLSLDALREAGRRWIAAHPGALEKTWDDIGPEDVFTIVYTSGTTGPPKGVVLTHRNIVFEAGALLAHLDIGEDDEQVLFLPMAHIFAKILAWTAIANGSSTSFAESIPKLVDNLKEVRPTFMGSVPRVYEKAYVKIQANFEEKRKKAVARMLIDWALRVGQRSSKELQAGRPVRGFLGFQQRLADKLVFKKVKETFGGRLRYFISGGAPLSQEIAEFFHAAGILILEGYGLTETTAATHVNRPDRFRFGTVGIPIPGVEHRIADDGEILVRGDNIMREYFGKPEATAEVLEKDGWFHTGDIGVIEEGGFLRITDRKKDIIVTAGGKNVAPQNIEGQLKSQCPHVSQVVVIGDKRKYLVALLTLNEEQIVPWARQRGIAFENMADLSEHPEVRRMLDAEIHKLNTKLASFETIKKYAVLPRDLSQDEGELTPTLKVKRKVVMEKYADVIERLYR